MTRPALPRIGWAALAALAVTAAFVPLPAALAWLAVVPLLVLPGAWFAAAAARAWPGHERAALAVALSPFLAAAPAASLGAAGVPFALAARVVLLAWGCVAALEAAFAPSRRFGAAAEPARGPGALAAWAPALAWSALVAVMLAANPWLPPRSDGWFHAGVTLQIAQRGLPPEDPYFAGVPLLYFWGEHAWAAMGLALQPALDVWTPLVAFNVAAAAAVLLALSALVRVLGGGGRASVAAALLAVLGYAPGAWVWIAGRAVRGDVTGFAEISNVVALGADPVMATLSRGLLHASLAFFGDKFLVLTPFSMGLALFALGGAALAEAAARRPGAGARLFALIAAALWTHAVVGDVLVLLALAAMAALVLRPQGARAAFVPVLVIGAAVAGAGLLVAPYLLAITAGKHGQLGVRLPREAVTSLVWGGALVVPAGFAWLARHARGERAAWVLLAAALPLVLLGVLLKLPENNQSKFLNLLFLLLAAPAAIAWLGVWDRAGGAARAALACGGALLVLPTAALALWAFATECGRSPGSWHEPDAGTRQGLAWVRERTAPGAAFADLSGAADLIAVGGRSVVWGGRRGERDWGADRDALQSRRLAVQALALGAEPGPAERAMLAALHRDVIVTARAADSADARSGWNVLPRSPGFRELFRNESVAFYRWEGGR